MRRSFSIFVVSGVFLAPLGCKTSPERSEAQAATAKTLAIRTAEAGCASCIYEMEGVAGCQLAVKIDGKPYLVTGADVNAHRAGLCASAKKAKIAGKIEGDKFVATSFELQP